MRTVLVYDHRMVFPLRSALLAFGGTLYGTEAWTMTLRLTPPATIGDQVAWQAACDAVHGVIGAWWPTGESSAPATHVWTKLNEIRPDGRYNQAYTILSTRITPIAGNGSVVKHPPQVSLVATLETGVTRGNAARGRIFIPCPRRTIGNDGMLVQNDALGAATAVKGLLDNINAIDPDMKVHVMSPGGVKDPVGAQRLVTGVSVGRVLDTMRSRRAQLAEGRSTVALATVP